MNVFRAFLVLVFFAFTAALNAQDLREPHILRGVDPVYPPDALAARPMGGTIRLYVEIDRDGKVTDVEAFGPSITCEKSNPLFDELRDAAVNAAKRTSFEPATRGGVPIDGFLFMSYKIEPQNQPKMEPEKPATIEQMPAPNPPAEPGKKIVGSVVNGIAILLPKPAYPKPARKYKLSGSVIISVVIDEHGNVLSAWANSGNPLFLAAAAQAVCQAKFTPTLLSGQPVKVSGAITYNFTP